MNVNKKMTYDEYIEKGLLEAIEEMETTDKRYTQEEFFAEWDRFIDNWEAESELKRCIS